MQCFYTLQMARRNAHRSPAHGRKFETGKRIPPTVSNHFRVSVHLFQLSQERGRERAGGRKGGMEGGREREREERERNLNMFLISQNSLAELMEKVNSSKPHFIRCIKPNGDKAPNSFTSVYVERQLRYTGVMETARIRQLGFPTRLTFSGFCRRYVASKCTWSTFLRVHVPPPVLSPPGVLGDCYYFDFQGIQCCHTMLVQHMHMHSITTLDVQVQLLYSIHVSATIIIHNYYNNIWQLR